MQVAGSASREHKHESHNTESFNNNFRGCCVRRKLAGGLKTRVIFYKNNKNRIAKLELKIIYKRRSYQSIYRGIYTMLATHVDLCAFCRKSTQTQVKRHWVPEQISYKGGFVIVHLPVNGS